MDDGQKKSWIRVIFTPLIPMYREVITASLFVNTLALAVPIFTMQVFDRVVPAEEAGIPTLTMFGLGMLAVVLFDFFLRQTRSRIMQRAALRIVVAEKIIQAVESPMDIQGQECSVAASIGISMFPHHAKDTLGLIECADRAMYAVKRGDGDVNYHVYAPDTDYRLGNQIS